MSVRNDLAHRSLTMRIEGGATMMDFLRRDDVRTRSLLVTGQQIEEVWEMLKRVEAASHARYAERNMGELVFLGPDQ